MITHLKIYNVIWLYFKCQGQYLWLTHGKVVLYHWLMSPVMSYANMNAEMSLSYLKTDMQTLTNFLIYDFFAEPFFPLPINNKITLIIFSVFWNYLCAFFILEIIIVIISFFNFWKFIIMDKNYVGIMRHWILHFNVLCSFNFKNQLYIYIHHKFTHCMHKAQLLHL